MFVEKDIVCFLMYFENAVEFWQWIATYFVGVFVIYGKLTFDNQFTIRKVRLKVIQYYIPFLQSVSLLGHMVKDKTIKLTKSENSDKKKN